MSDSKIRIMFTNFVDVSNFNAQSLNVREMACRLNPRRFEATLFYATEPDSRLVGLRQVRLIKLPPRLGALRMLIESIRNYNILFNVELDRFGYLYFHLPRIIKGSTYTVAWVESDIALHLKYAEERLTQLFNKIYHKMDFYVATTEYVAEKTAQDFGIGVSKVICTGVDRSCFSPPRGRKGNPLQVLFVGHLIERKGPQFVLKAAAQFREVKFVLVGERRKDFYKQLFRTVKAEQLTNVTFLSPMPQAMLAQLMRDSDILLHPAVVESPGKVLTEAGATGLPAIIFSQYRSPAVANGITGFQVETFEEMLNRLRLLIEDRNLRLQMGEAAIEYAKQFDWDVIVRQWEEAFEQVVSGVRQRSE